MYRRDRPPIIALDGNHRTGKGTQLDILSETLSQEGYDPLILRGDGTRPGEGGSAGDPFSLWWQDFKSFAKGHHNHYSAWRIGARQLLAEAAIWLSELPKNGIILFDRAGISRSQMTLKENLPVCFETMYLQDANTPQLSNKEILQLQPDLTVFLAADTDTLLERLDENDPKYTFRRNNIISSNDFFERGYEAYQKLGLSETMRISVEDSVENIAGKIKSATIDRD